MNEATPALASAPSSFAGSDWFDPLEEAVRGQVRWFIEQPTRGGRRATRTSPSTHGDLVPGETIEYAGLDRAFLAPAVAGCSLESVVWHQSLPDPAGPHSRKTRFSK